MNYEKRMLGMDVLTAARKRMRVLADSHDRLVVSFSGGKDSMAVLLLAHEIHEELGLGPVDAFFFDEEFLPASVPAFVEKVAALPWVRLRYYAVPLKSNRYVMGERKDVVFWDPTREHVRPIPEGALQVVPGVPEGTVLDLADVNGPMAASYPGKVCILLGLRAQESYFRQRAIFMRRHMTYLCPMDGWTKGRPIYDWREEDVFRFCGEHDALCDWYDASLLGGHRLRVATPMHSEGASVLHAVATSAPELWERILAIFPDEAVQARYGREQKRGADVDFDTYGQDYRGVRAWVDETITDPEQHRLAVKRLADAIKMGGGDYAVVPPRWLLKIFAAGAFKRPISLGLGFSYLKECRAIVEARKKAVSA